MSEREPRLSESRLSAWSPLQRRLHWFVAVLVLVQYVLQRPMHEAVTAVAAGASVTFGQFLVSTLHTWGGAIVALLVIWRLVLRRRTPRVRARDRLQRLAGWHHALLYGALLAMVASGALHYHAGVEQAGDLHELGKWVLGGLVAVHVLAAAWHVVSGERWARRPRAGCDG